MTPKCPKCKRPLDTSDYWPLSKYCCFQCPKETGLRKSEYSYYDENEVIRSPDRLSQCKCYLAGPIDRCPNLGTQWRNTITPELEKLGVVVLDPMNKDKFLQDKNDVVESNPAWRDHINNLKETEQYDEYSKQIKYNIVKIDYRLCDYADFLILYIDTDIFTCGSFFETFLANFLKRPIVVWCKQGKKNIPAWLFGILPHQLFFSSMDEVLEYLRGINNDEVINTYGRWLFLNFNEEG